MNSDYQIFEAAAREALSPQRFHHSVCVAKAAEKLAPLAGVDVNDAKCAGVLHDIFKEKPVAAQIEYLRNCGITLRDDIIAVPKAIHAISGAAYAEQHMSAGSEIAGAIRWHTTGRAGMTPLEIVVCLADYISDDRNFEGVEQLRCIARKNPEDALKQALLMTIEKLEKQDKHVLKETREAFLWLKDAAEKKGTNQ